MNPDFRELLRALSDAAARFLVVGAYAVSFHSEPRATGDLDLWIDATPDNAARVYRALAAFGAPLTELSETDLCTPDVVFQIGVAPRRTGPLMATVFNRLGPYTIEREIGRGGMAEVFLATDTRSGQRVALKVVPRGADREGRWVRPTDRSRPPRTIHQQAVHVSSRLPDVPLSQSTANDWPRAVAINQLASSKRKAVSWMKPTLVTAIS